MNSSLVSVIVPVYKVEKYLDKCIISIVNQTYKNLEIILVDDGSPDSCPEICEQWKKHDNRIQVIHKKNGGLSDARNEGLKYSHGDYILFVDSDDYIALVMIEKMMNAIISNRADMVICQFAFVTSDGRCERNIQETFENQILNTEEALKLLLEDYKITAHIWRKLLKREILADIQFPIRKEFEDIFIMHSLIMRCKKIVYLDDVYYFYLQNNNGIIKSYSIKSRRNFLEAVQKRTVEIIEKYPNLREFVNQKQLLKDCTIWEDVCNKSKNYNKKERINLLYDIRKDIRNIPLKYSKNIKIRIFLELIIIRYCPIMQPFYYKICYKLMKKLQKKIRNIENTIKFFSKIRKEKKKKFIVLSTPTHGNLGDRAIVMGEDKFIQKYFSEYKIYHIPFDVLNYIGCILLKNIIHKGDYIGVHGGGNIGTLYPGIHKRQEKCIRKLNSYPLFIFPQTLFYDNTQNGKELLEITKKVYRKNNKMLLTLREKESYKFAKRNFPATNSILIPDMVLNLTYNKSKKIKRKGVLMCLRNDSEKTLPIDKLHFLFEKMQNRFDYVADIDTHIYYNLNEREADKAIKRLWKRFSETELVVTDRLHGMVFAAITQTPCIVLQSLSHKLTGVYQWIQHLDYIKLITDLEELDKIIDQVLISEKKYNTSHLEPFFELLAKEIISV